MNLKVVFDTNTLISGLLFWGNEADLLRVVDEGAVKLCVSDEMLRELDRVLSYERIKRYVDLSGRSKEEYLEKIVHLAELVHPKNHVHVVAADPSDNHILECAVEAGAEYIVSGDSHLLELKSYKGVRVVSSKRMLEVLGKN
ncbi:MAG: putative toxin-antitoxin system toxin component, PIN family [Candidatus Altiarchaeota archaeon]